jgi:hypothetical protein
MTEDFLDSHKRHWDDAERLFNAERWANADHLYGISAECGLKKLLEVLQGDPLGPNQKRHIWESRRTDNCWNIFDTYRSGHQLAAKFPMPDNPFNDWDISQRYAHQSYFDRNRAESHRNGAEIIKGFVTTADLEGLL